MYVDSDIVFLRPPDRLWALLSHFNASQLAGVAPEHEEPRVAWYNRFARHPFYGATGINSGVMLMNLTRIRSAYFKVGRETGALYLLFSLFCLFSFSTLRLVRLF